MKKIKEYVHNIQDELEDAEKYAKLAMTSRADDPEDADMYLTLSKQEVNHATMLHNAAEKCIRAYRAEKGEAPAPMQAVYDWEHDKMIDALARVKALQEMAAGK